MRHKPEQESSASGLSFKWKLRLYFGALVLGLLGLAAFSTGSIVLRDFRIEVQRREAEIHGVCNRLLNEELRRIDDQVAKVLEDPAFTKMVRRDLDYPREVTQPEWFRLARQLSSAYDLPLLKILDAEGIILSSAHWEQSFKLRDSPGFILALESQTGTRLVRERTGEGDFLALMSARWSRQPRLYVIIAGVRADPDLQQLLSERAGIPTRFQISQRDSSATLSSQPSASTDLVNTSRISVQASPSEDLGRLLLEFDRSPIGDLKNRLAQIFGTATLLGMILAWVLGMWISGRVTRPLEELAQGVSTLATGQTPQAIAVQGSVEIRGLVTSFNSMSANLAASREQLRSAERIAAWRDVARRIAHEIKNALVPIQLSVENVARSVQTGRGDLQTLTNESVTTVRGEIEGLTRLVNSFNEFARLPDPEKTLNRLQGSWDRATAAFSSKLGIHQEGLEQLPPLLYDEDQIRRCLHNFVKNANEAGASNIRIVGHETRSKENIHTWTIQIADDGPGIASEDLKRIFDPYFTRKKEGTGLGLAIVYKIIMDHGWKIRVESNDGTAFVIDIPVETLEPVNTLGAAETEDPNVS